jgi:tryptophan synthase alpha chain
MTLPRGAARIRAAFDAARTDDRAALVAYLMAGHPDDAASLAAAEAALEAGADLLEVGVPFSDPVADGPVIAAAGHATLAAGGGLESALRLVRALREAGHAQPLLCMGYLNPLVARGVRASLAALADAGADGLIVPDLPAGEDRQLERLIADAGLGVTFLVTPNTSDQRLEAAIRASTAFLYVVPLFGVTGARDGVADTTGPLLDRIRATAAGRIPVGVGFGVSRPEQVRELAPHADGVIVGSAIVAAMGRDGAPGVGRLVASLAGATSAHR